MTRRIQIALSLLVFASPALAAPGDLTVSPTRIVFEDRTRSEQVLLVNRGETTETYRIGMIEMHMDEDGQLHELQGDEIPASAASPLIRYSPRQVELAPGQGQTVRLLLRKPEGLPDGEYRSRLLFYALPDESAGTQIDRFSNIAEDEIAISIQPVFRITIPVIVRHGETHADFEFSDLALEADPEPKAHLTIHRSGNRSMYGDLDISFKPDISDQLYLLAHMHDFVVYATNDQRKVITELEPPEGLELQSGTLSAIFRSNEDESERVLAETSIRIP